MATFPPPALAELAQLVGDLLKKRSQTVCVAETAAGGLVSSALLSIPGASKIYRGGLTLYTMDSRICFAGWTQRTVDEYRGPSRDVVKGIAEHVRGTLRATYCICESGTAGPNGGSTPNRKPGYVAIAVASVDGSVTREITTHHGKNREKNMVAFAVEALKLFRDVLKEDAKP